MIFPFLVLLLLVLLFLFLLVIILNLRIMMSKMCQLVRIQRRVNLSQEHPLNLIRKRLKTLGLRRETLKSLNRRSSIYHHCRATGHTRPNCYKQLATQQSNGMISSGSQNHLQSSLAPLGDLLKALMFLSNLNGFNPFSSPPVQGFNQRKGSSKVWKKKDSK